MVDEKNETTNAAAATATDERITLTRRQAVTALGVGAAALTATHLGVAYQAAQWAQQQPRDEIAGLQTEIEKLKGLLALYESLEKIGIDVVIAGALAVYKGLLDGLRGGVGALSAGAATAEIALNGFQNTFVIIRGGLQVAENAVNNIAALLKGAQVFLEQATSPAKSLLEQMRQFFDDLLGKIPFVGDSIKRTIDGVVGLVNAIPNMVISVNTGLLEPLRAGWFSEDNAKNLQGALLDPISKQVLTPLKKFLADLDQTLARWESDVAKPVRAALDNRETVRKQIAEYKQKNKMS